MAKRSARKAAAARRAPAGAPHAAAAPADGADAPRREPERAPKRAVQRRPDPAPDRLRRLLPGAALVAATLLAYLPALGNGFIWDDDDYVTANPTLRSLAGLARIWLEPGAVPQYYPLTFTSLWLDYRIGGLAPFGYHLVNVLLHAASAVLAWRVLRRLAVPGAWLAAAIFALHPVHVESVAWVTERKNVLSGALYLGSMLAYLRFAGIGAGAPTGGSTEGAGSRRLYAIALALFAAGLLAKTVVCTLPAALLLLLWWKRGRITARDAAWLAPFFAIGAALAMVTIAMERGHVGAVGRDWDLSFVDRCLIAGRAVCFYLGKLAWPADLTFIYPRWAIDAGAAWQYVFPAAAAAAAVTLLALGPRLGWGPLAAYLFFVATLGPALGFVDVFPMRYSFVADHFQYLASLGPIALAAACAALAARRLAAASSESSRRLAQGLGAAVLLALAVLTARQTRIYRDLPTLWADTIARNPGAWMAHNNLGLLLLDAGDVPSAKAHFQAALAVKPDDAFAQNNLGRALAAQGRMEDAVAALREAVRLDPGRLEAWNNLGNALAALARYDDAIAAYRRAIEIAPRFPDAYGNLANVLVLTGRTGAALEVYETAVRLDPAFADARYNYGVALEAEGRLPEAEAQLREAVALRPQSADVHHRLGVVLARQGKTSQASASQGEALRLRPGWDAAQRELAALAAAGADPPRRP